MKSWVAAPSLLLGGSRFVQAPEYPELSRTVIEPPALSGAEEGVEPVAPAAPGEDEELLHAAAVSASAAAPARQAVRTDISRNLIGIHLLVINRTLVGDKYRVDRPEICLGYSHPPEVAARSKKRGPPDREPACIRPPPVTSRGCAIPQSRPSGPGNGAPRRGRPGSSRGGPLGLRCLRRLFRPRRS